MLVTLACVATAQDATVCSVVQETLVRRSWHQTNPAIKLNVKQQNVTKSIIDSSTYKNHQFQAAYTEVDWWARMVSQRMLHHIESVQLGRLPQPLKKSLKDPAVSAGHLLSSQLECPACSFTFLLLHKRFELIAWLDAHTSVLSHK